MNNLTEVNPKGTPRRESKEPMRENLSEVGPTGARKKEPVREDQQGKAVYLKG
jgi:hypothetical protein